MRIVSGHLLRLLVSALLAGLALEARAAGEAFAMRGYYMTFMRMPLMGLPQWKQMVDCIQQDGGNTLLLWMGGGFRSKQHPVTWQYNREHKNIETDFVGELIDYAHRKEIKVVLCLTPFAYDGVNQYSLDHPEVRAMKKDGQPADYWGMHSWGYNLCPSKPDAQRFMMDYAREMLFDFYPNADGVMIESSDYAICFCSDCGPRFFDKEFQFVRRISDEVWQRKPEAIIMVYPHYFSGATVPGFDIKAATQPFDSRWTLFFTPHSAHVETNLLGRAKASVYSDEGLSLGTPARIGKAAQLANDFGLTGYIPSLEPFSCPSGPPTNPGPKLKPFHFEWLADGQAPLNELLMRVNRIAYREYAREPGLSNNAFKQVLAREFFKSVAPDDRVDDLLYLQESYGWEAQWFVPSPLTDPARLKARAAKEDWPRERIQVYQEKADRLRMMAARYRNSGQPTEKEMGRIAGWVAQKWEK
jgi:hypothetical protein